LRLISTSHHFLHPYKDINKVFEPLVCCLKGILGTLIPFHHPKRVAPDLGILGICAVRERGVVSGLQIEMNTMVHLRL